MALTIDRKVQGDLVVVSTSPQADATTAATLNKLLVWDEESVIRQVRDAETNEKEKKGGFVEATAVDVKGLTAEGSLNTAKMQPDHLAWACRMLMGAPTTTTPGGATDARLHVFKMTTYPTQAIYFTAAHRKGGGSAGFAPADYARFRGMAISQLELRAQKNEFLALNLSLVGLGYVDDGIVTETFSPTWSGNAATVTLTADPEGSTDGERANRVFAVCDADDDGHFETVLTITSYTAASNDLVLGGGPASGAHAVRVTYDRDDAVDTWKTQVAGASGETEYKLKATNMRLYLNRGMDTSDAAPAGAGGQFGECEIDDFTWTFNTNAAASSCWATTDPPDVSGFAQQVETGDYVQRLTLNRGIRDWMLKQARDLDVPFGVEIWSIGPEIETGQRYEVHTLFPYCKILDNSQEVNEGKWRDAAEIAVLQDPGTASGGLQNSQVTVAVSIKNEVTSYA